jgi:2-hydroxychromene-2-carboxylate isomerase
VTIDFWFDFSCPYAYLAATQRRRLAAEAGVPVVLQPFLLGGVFHAIGQVQNLSATLSPPKARHNRLDLLRWATLFEAPLRTPVRHPNRTVDALRALLATPAHAQEAVVDSFYAAYWAEAEDLADRVVLHRRLSALGLDADALLAHADSQAIRDELRQRTARAVEVGVFGAPAFVVGEQLFWGQDRIPLVVRAARGWRPDPQYDTFQF